MSALYFGAPAKNANSVPENIRALGLEYLRTSPSQVNITPLLTYSQPGYTLYKAHLAGMIHAAKNSISVSTRKPIYYPMEHRSVPSFVKNPTIIWSYNYKLSPDRIEEVKRRFGANETKSKGKLAFKAQWKDQAWWDGLKAETGIVRQTPSGTTDINMATFVQYIVIWRVIDAFLRVNQYPAFKTNDLKDVAVKMMTIANQEGTMESPLVDLTLDDGTTVTSQLWIIGMYSEKIQVKADRGTKYDRNFIMHANVPVDFDTYTPVITDDAHIPTAYTGQVFPYVSDLADFDFKIVGRVFTRYFMGLLGAESGEALENLEAIKSGWGNLAKTEWGLELAHILRVIEITLDVQCFVKPYQNPSGQYSGCIIFGGLYSLAIGDKIFKPVERTELLAIIRTSTPHVASLTSIFSKVRFTSEAERITSMGTIRNMRDLSFVVRTQGFLDKDNAEITQMAYRLSFKSEPPYLAPTAFNIATILRAIADESISENQFPLHPEAVTSNSRTTRLLSAFGIEVPTFIVPGGKKMSLETSFAVPDVAPNGTKTTREVHKLAVSLVSLKKAVDDFETVKKEKYVFNPYGNQMGSRNSTDRMTKAFEKESADMIIVSLRLAVGAVQKAAAASKRAVDDLDEEDSNRAKKRRLFDV